MHLPAKAINHFRFCEEIRFLLATLPECRSLLAAALTLLPVAAFDAADAGAGVDVGVGVAVDVDVDRNCVCAKDDDDVVELRYSLDWAGAYSDHHAGGFSNGYA